MGLTLGQALQMHQELCPRFPLVKSLDGLHLSPWSGMTYKHTKTVVQQETRRVLFLGDPHLGTQLNKPSFQRFLCWTVGVSIDQVLLMPHDPKRAVSATEKAHTCLVFKRGSSPYIHSILKKQDPALEIFLEVTFQNPNSDRHSPGLLRIDAIEDPTSWGMAHPSSGPAPFLTAPFPA
jgi:hypothetical protein